jgi:cyclopropane fatty-acyl-phospholipid synthase-like methyltransferase
MKSQIHQLLDKLPFTSSVKFNGIILPPKRRRWCGSEFRDDDYYFQSAILEAKRLKFEFGIKNNDNILDIGCGFGRLPIGLNKIFDSINYIGIDVHRPSIVWCKKFLSKNTSQLNFIHFNIKNERYNEDGNEFGDDFKFPIDSKSQDLIYLYSVFSHMKIEEMRKYFIDFKRIIKKNGNIFFTAFVEKNVSDYSINPEGYIFEEFSGPLHVVRYDFDFLLNELKIAGFKIEKIFESTETDKQTGLYLSQS